MKINNNVRYRDDLPGFLIFLNQKIFVTNEMGKQIFMLCRNNKKWTEVHTIMWKKYRVKSEETISILENFLEVGIVEREAHD